jgi:hypothetical protein
LPGSSRPTKSSQPSRSKSATAANTLKSVTPRLTDENSPAASASWSRAEVSHSMPSLVVSVSRKLPDHAAGGEVTGQVVAATATGLLATARAAASARARVAMVKLRRGSNAMVRVPRASRSRRR